MFPFSPPSGHVNAYSRVDKATSEFLNCPDWRINMGICDTINSKPWLARDYVRAIRSRLQHRNPNVQLLSLTLLETVVKNCSEHVHLQIVERKILQEMIKIVKKKSNMRVRERILLLIDTWREAFGSRGGKITAYYIAYEELKRHGIDFPRRSQNIAPSNTYGHHRAGASSSTTTEPVESVSLSTLDYMRNALDLLSDMLQAVDPYDRKAMKDEVIVDLYDQCRSNQKKLGQTLSSTIDEEILRQGIQFNDNLQYIIEKHDAIASGSPIPVKPPSLSTHRPRVNQGSSSVASASISNEIQEEPIDSALIASRHYKTHTVVSQNGTTVSASTSDRNPLSDPALAMALVPSDPPPPAEKDMIDLSSPPLSPARTLGSTSSPNQAPTDLTVMESQPHLQLTNSYAVPWAPTRPQLEYEPQPLAQPIEQQANYIPPPWAPTPGYYCNPYSPNYSASTYYNNISSAGSGGLNPYVPSYRLFEDLNVLGNMRTSGTPGASGQCMLGSRK
ncbi:hypothetical protein R6Q57_002293 [Mikania cordata]